MDGSDGLIAYRGKAMGLNKPCLWAWMERGKRKCGENKVQIQCPTYTPNHRKVCPQTSKIKTRKAKNATHLQWRSLTLEESTRISMILSANGTPNKMWGVQKLGENGKRKNDQMRNKICHKSFWFFISCPTSSASGFWANRMFKSVIWSVHHISQHQWTDSVQRQSEFHAVV